MSSPSLPPGIEGQIQGILTLSIKEVEWDVPIEDVLFRVKFWGEETSGILFQSSAIYLSYNIKTSILGLIKYLTDMNYLIVDVLNQQGKLIGQMRVHLKNIGKNPKNINFRGQFPIVLKEIGKAGHAVIEIKVKIKRPEEEILASFQKNELQTLDEEKINQKKNDEKEIASKINPKKIFVPKSALNKIPKPKKPSDQVNNKFTPTFNHGDKNEEIFSRRSEENKKIENKDNENDEQISESKNPNQKNEEIYKSMKNSVLNLKIDAFELSSSENFQFLYIQINFYRCLTPNPEEFIPDSLKISSISKKGQKFIFSYDFSHEIRGFFPVSKTILDYGLEFLIISPETSETLGSTLITWEELLDQSGLKSAIKIPTNSLNDVENGLLEIETLVLTPLKNISETHSPNILFLFIDYIDKIEGLPNLYIAYKTFPDSSRITTPIYWNYQGSPIRHQMLMPCSDCDKTKFTTSVLVLEVWNKQKEKDLLIGICKMKLERFSGEVFENRFPVVAVDDFTPIWNPIYAREEGYIKACLAYGNALQIQRLSKTFQIEPFPKELEKLESPEKNIYIKETDERNENNTKTIKKKFKDQEITSQSFDNIENIAEALNPISNKNELEKYNEIKTVKNEELKNLFENQPNKFKTEKNTLKKASPTIPPKPNIKQIDEILVFIKNIIIKEKINLNQDLKSIDKLNIRRISSENLFYFLSEYRLGLSQEELNTLIDYIISSHPSSNSHEILFTDILDSLGFFTLSHNTEYKFTIIISSIHLKSIQNFPSKSCYLKILFPKESNWVESDLIDSSVLNMNSDHSFILPNSIPLPSFFQGEEGILIKFVKFSRNYSESLLGKGVLPIEEFIELQNNSKIHRTICLFSDKNSEIIGKLDLSLHFSKKNYLDSALQSSELIFSKENQIERMIPKNNVLTVIFDNFQVFESINEGYNEIQFILFYEDPLLNQKYKNSLSCKFKSPQMICHEKFQMDLTLDQLEFDYFKSKFGMLQFISGGNLIGQSKVSLVQMLIHPFVTEIYEILTESGKTIAKLKCSMSILLEEEEKIEETQTLKPKIRDGELLLINIGEMTGKIIDTSNVYVKFQWVNGETFHTPPCCKDYSFFVEFIDKKIEYLEFEIWKKNFEDDDTRLGRAVVKLSDFPIDEYFTIYGQNQKYGKIKIKIEKGPKHSKQLERERIRESEKIFENSVEIIDCGKIQHNFVKKIRNDLAELTQSKVEKISSIMRGNW